MTTYNSYAEAKINNPESEIVTTGKDWEFNVELKGKFQALIKQGSGEQYLDNSAWAICNPNDHCMTVEKFLAGGHKFVKGDVVDDAGEVGVIETEFDIDAHNEPYVGDDNRYVLRAAALEEKPKRVKVEYVKCEYGDKVSNIVMDFENNEPLCKSVNDEYWTIDELDDLFQLILNDCDIYRKVETEIDERQEFIERAEELIDISKTAEYSLGKMYDAGCRFPD
ncbi:coil containing protein [Vibrio phage 1.216.O._10N.222.55.C12]|nr:coil containing protein [Vibrio phage 1.216.O._10N.222.55.C12]